MFSSVLGYHLSLCQLHKATHALARHAFRPVATQNHLRQVQSLMDFCHHYHLQFLLQPSQQSATILLTHQVLVFHQHTELYFWHTYASYTAGSNTHSLGFNSGNALLRAVDITMRTPPARHFPILSNLLTKVCSSHPAWDALPRP